MSSPISTELRWDEGTTTRIRERFLQTERETIDDGEELLCVARSRCEPSVGGAQFVAGQLSWVGRRYALVDVDAVSVRILVVPKQTGRGGAGHSHVTHEMRAAQVEGAKRGPVTQGTAASASTRTHHMAGTEAALELLLGATAGSRHVDLADVGRTHVFDCFAMVNATRCSRVGATVDGEGSPTMYRACRAHLRRALELLEPTIVVCEGMSGDLSPAGSVKEVVTIVEHLANHVYVAELGQQRFVVVELKHPSRKWPSYKAKTFVSDVAPKLRVAREWATAGSRQAGC